jgi:hypothetical protein
MKALREAESLIKNLPTVVHISSYMSSKDLKNIFELGPKDNTLGLDVIGDLF